MLTKFFDRLYEKDRSYYPRLEKWQFLEQELEYFNQLNEKTKTKFRNIISSIVRFLEKEIRTENICNQSPRQIQSYFDPNNPLKNYDEMFWKHESYLKNIEWSIGNLKRFREYTREFTGIDNMHELYIGNVIHKAKQEIKRLVFTPNNNSGQLINSTKTRINSIANALTEIIKEYELNHVKNGSSYVFFFEAVQPFWDFSDWFRIEILGESLTETENLSEENTKDTPKTIKTFPSYFEQNKIFANKLKNEFTTEKGKNMKLVIEALKELGLIKLESRGFKDFYERMKQYFNRDIGTYQSINDFKDWKTDAYKSDYEIIMN